MRVAAAVQLTALQLRRTSVAHLDSARDMLTSSLQRLRLTEGTDGNADRHLRRLPSDFTELIHLRQLHLTVDEWGIGRLPTGCDRHCCQHTCTIAGYFASSEPVLSR